MATKNTTGTASAEAAALPAAKPAPLFVPFSWTNHTAMPGVLALPSHRVLSALSAVRDLTNGAALVMEIIERDLVDGLEEEDAPPSLLSDSHRETLMRMAITASRMAAREAETLTDWVQEHGGRQTQEGTR